MLHWFLIWQLPVNKNKTDSAQCKELLSIGIQPDIIVLRAEMEVAEEHKRKLHCSATYLKNCHSKLRPTFIVFCSIGFKEERLDDIVCERFGWKLLEQT